MKYVISDEELKDFAIKCVNDDGVGELYIDVRIQDLTQSKTPVEEIAEGNPCKISGDVVNFSLNQDQNKIFKIYIEVIK